MIFRKVCFNLESIKVVWYENCFAMIYIGYKKHIHNKDLWDISKRFVELSKSTWNREET